LSKKCRQCGKPTLSEEYELCLQCSSAKRKYRVGAKVQNARQKENLATNGGGRAAFDSDYLLGGYFDEKGNLRREVIVEWPEKVASELSEKGMTETALRRFFMQVKALELKRRSGESFDRLRPKILKLIPQVVYAVSRSTQSSGVPGSFKEFVDRNVELAGENKENFKAFAEHFECVVAFFKERKQGRNR